MKKPVLSPDSFRGMLKDLVQAIDPHTEADPAAVLGTGLAFFAHAFGPRPHAQQGSIKHPLNINTMIIGSSSRGKKGESMRIISDIFEMASPEYSSLDSLFVHQGIPGSGAAMVSAIEENHFLAVEEGLWEKDFGFPILFIDEEFAGTLMDMRIDKKLSTYFRKLWDGGRKATIIHKIRKNGKLIATIIKQPHACIIGHITPGEFKKVLGESDLAGGSMNRILAFAAERSKKLPFGGNMEESEMRSLAGRIVKIVNRGKKVTSIPMTPEAAKLWVKMYDEITEIIESGDRMEDWAGRAHPYCMRLAAIYALTSTPEGRDVRITPDDLKAALGVIKYSIESIKWANDSKEVVVTSRLAKRVLKYLEENGVMTPTLLGAKLGGREPAATVAAAVAEIGGLKFRNDKVTGGRKGFFYCLPKDLPEGVEVIEIESFGDEDSDEEGPVVQGKVVKMSDMVRVPRPSETAGEPEEEERPKPARRTPQRASQSPRAASSPTSERAKVASLFKI